MNYYAIYVEDSSPKIAAFTSNKALDAFVRDFPVSADQGNWIDLTFKGNLLWGDEQVMDSLRESLKTRKKKPKKVKRKS